MPNIKESSNVLLITPPFTQLNCPYPATAYLTGFLKTHHINVVQADLGLETFLSVFSKKGLTELFRIAADSSKKHSENILRIFSLKSYYIETIEPVIRFLQGNDPTLANRICNDDYLPEASRFASVADLDLSFGSLGIQDRAKYLATLYIDDLSDFITEVIDADFGFSKYAERIALSANWFEPIEGRLKKETGIIDGKMLVLLEHYIQTVHPEIIGFSIPFPGNLYCALKCGQYIKSNYPDISIVLGGGYTSTELRDLKSDQIFRYCDYIVLDDGEEVLLNIIENLKGSAEQKKLSRTYFQKDGKTIFREETESSVCTSDYVPDYSGLKLDQYVSLIEVTNPMHRLWSDGRWNKLTLAKGCYWARCAFCDTHLPYIRDYRPYTAKNIADKMENIIEKTGNTGFHFVDEAAPLDLLQELSLEILKRGLTVTWWTNVRFEKRFSTDLCRLMAEAGCIAVTGGLEVASDRLLKLIQKGVTVEQATQVAANFTDAGIMVHAYLMYGFPTQTARETINSLEVVRQMFGAGVLHSAYWHQFSMTAHSPVGKNPERFNVIRKGPEKGNFAWNDLIHEDPTGARHYKYGEGLKKALYNYMLGVGLDYEPGFWFDFKTPSVNISPMIVENALIKGENRIPNMKGKSIIWMGGEPVLEVKKARKGKTARAELKLYEKSETVLIKTDLASGEWLVDFLKDISVKSGNSRRFNDVEQDYESQTGQSFYQLMMEKSGQKLREHGLLFLKPQRR